MLAPAAGGAPSGSQLARAVQAREVLPDSAVDTAVTVAVVPSKPITVPLQLEALGTSVTKAVTEPNET